MSQNVNPMQCEKSCPASNVALLKDFRLKAHALLIGALALAGFFVVQPDRLDYLVVCSMFVFNSYMYRDRYRSEICALGDLGVILLWFFASVHGGGLSEPGSRYILFGGWIVVYIAAILMAFLHARRLSLP